MNTRATPYHGFIPREEVQAVEAWAFDPMDGRHAERVRADVVDEAPAPPEALIESIRQQAYAEGFDHGRLAGGKEVRDALEAQARKTADEQARRLAGLFSGAQAELEQIQQGLGDEVLALACDIARQVVRREVVRREALRAVVHEALGMAVHDAQPATVHLHPEDIAMLGLDGPDAAWPAPVRLSPDPELSRGGCVVQTSASRIDGTLEQRWKRAVANLGLDSTWSEDD